MTDCETAGAQHSLRQTPSPILYELWRKDMDSVHYLFVPDEYEALKNHVMMAIREELKIEALKDTISQLTIRISQLEYENTILKANATEETLSQIKRNSDCKQKKASNTNGCLTTDEPVYEKR